MSECSLGYAHSYAYGALGCRCPSCREWVRRKSAARRANQTPEAHQRELADNRARKERYRGSCVVCGRRTTGCNGPDKAPRYCAEHAPQNPDRRTNMVWTRELIIERIRLWAELYGEPPAMPDWNANKAREMGDEWRAIRFENDERWPWFTSVVRRFGSWSAGIEAAGFEARQPNGGGGNHLRRRDWAA